MANSILNIRSAFTQAGYNERMAKIVSYELAYAAIIGASLLAYWFGWQWFFWGIVLIPVAIALGLCVPLISDLIIVVFATLWATPFLFIGALGITAGYVMAVVAFLLAIWVHAKAFTFYSDLSRWD